MYINLRSLGNNSCVSKNLPLVPCLANSGFRNTFIDKNANLVHFTFAMTYI